MKLILENCDILTKMNNKWVIKHGYSIIIDDGFIKNVFKGKKIIDGFTIINCIGKIVMPGLINAHTHLGDTLYRGIIKNVSLREYLRKTEHFNKKFTDNNRRIVSANLTLLDLFANGITTCCVGRGWHLFNSEDFRYFGMNFLDGYVVMNIKRLMEEYVDFEKDFLKIKLSTEKKYKNVKLGIFIHSLNKIDNKLLEKIKKVSFKEKIKIIIHTSENKTNGNNSPSDLEILESYSLVSKDTILVHCIHFSSIDYKIIKKYKPNIVLCPSSNLKLLSGIANFNRLKKTGCNICIATDGGSTNNSFNLFSEVKLASLLYNYQANKFIMGETDLLDFIITNPLKALGFSKVGKIKKNYRADMIFIKKDFIGIQPRKSIINNIIYSGDSHMINDVMINGNFVIRNGKFSYKLKAKETIDSFNKLADKL